MICKVGHRLASRMSQVGGEGAALAGNRRQEWSPEEAMARKEMSAAWLVRITGQGNVLVGLRWHNPIIYQLTNSKGPLNLHE